MIYMNSLEAELNRLERELRVAELNNLEFRELRVQQSYLATAGYDQNQILTIPQTINFDEIPGVLLVCEIVEENFIFGIFGKNLIDLNKNNDPNNVYSFYYQIISLLATEGFYFNFKTNGRKWDFKYRNEFNYLTTNEQNVLNPYYKKVLWRSKQNNCLDFNGIAIDCGEKKSFFFEFQKVFKNCDFKVKDFCGRKHFTIKNCLLIQMK